MSTILLMIFERTHINTNETIASLRLIKANKSAVADGISAEFYNCAGDILAQPLTALFNHVMLTVLYYDTRCAGLINPLQNRDSPSLPDNYRKIIITPVIGNFMVFWTIDSNLLKYALRPTTRFKMGSNQMQARSIIYSYWTGLLINVKQLDAHSMPVLLTWSLHLI